MTKRNERTSPGVDRDASAVMKFKVEYDDPIDGVSGLWVPLAFVKRAKRVAASALNQAPDKPKMLRGRLPQALGKTERMGDVVNEALAKPKRAAVKRRVA